ncbi:6219_t:CDS:2 [Ambispora gerdemannii]|uniref:6219_t:CDS:1 n=1 Tax=Ambispora gerdemannii TaxID=144530 RepID=A0A9N8V6M3_9GLOM|nr:6219_t:CDS:2 [Ambispora gerdemannii]
MACDLSDPSIMRAYEEVISMQDPTNWWVLRLASSSGGLDELGRNLKEETLYGFLRIENKFVFLMYLSEQISDVQRARGLVHGRAVALLFKMHQIQIRATTREEISEAKIRSKLIDEILNFPLSPEYDQNSQIILPPESEQQNKVDDINNHNETAHQLHQEPDEKSATNNKKKKKFRLKNLFCFSCSRKHYSN